MEFEKDENFEIELFDPEGGAKIGKVSRTAVTITNDDGKHSQILDNHKFNLQLCMVANNELLSKISPSKSFSIKNICLSWLSALIRQEHVIIYGKFIFTKILVCLGILRHSDIYYLILIKS